MGQRSGWQTVRAWMPLGAGLLLLGCAATAVAQAPEQRGSIPGVSVSPPAPPDPTPRSRDLFEEYDTTDPDMQRVLRDQARARNELRQKQVVEATALLLQVTRELRADMARNPSTALTREEQARLQQIEKLADFVRAKEKSD